MNTTQATRANRPEIKTEDVENDHEGVNIDVTLQHHNTTRVTKLNPAETTPVHVGNVEDAVDDGSRADDGSVYELTPPSRSVASLETSVENVAYERLDDNTTTSIPMQPSIRVFQGITEEATF